jgi:hypothetical protein
MKKDSGQMHTQSHRMCLHSAFCILCAQRYVVKTRKKTAHANVALYLVDMHRLGVFTQK